MIDDYAIVGGGLTGLAIAAELERRGRSFVLLEARDRLGGRAWSRPVGSSIGHYDVGPAWFWPGQPKMAALTQRLGLASFEQFSQGTLVFEDERGSIQRGLDVATMAGALRIDGGLSRLIAALAASLDPARISTSTAVERIHRQGDAIEIRTSGGSLAAHTVIVTAPPRVAVESIDFEPLLSDSQSRALAATPTWMAGHAKLIAVYDRPFWRAAGQSGDAISHRGPLTEIHDASPAMLDEGALFGFLGVPAQARAQHRGELESAAIEQLTALFGAQAASPKAVELVDWAQEPFTAVAADFAPPRAHPAYGLPPALAHVWDGRLRFASTETAASSGGLLEGALERALAVIES